MAAVDRLAAAAVRRRVAAGLRPLQTDLAVSVDELRHDPSGVPDDLLVGIRPPPVGPADRGRLRAALPVVPAATAAPPAAGAASLRSLPARRPARRDRIDRKSVVSGKSGSVSVNLV